MDNSFKLGFWFLLKGKQGQQMDFCFQLNEKLQQVHVLKIITQERRGSKQLWKERELPFSVTI